jgi:hypothetical protein
VRKRWITALAAVLGLLLSLPASAKDPKDQGFAGKWVLDKNNSQGSEMLADLRQDTKQSGTDFTIQNRFPEPANGVAPLLYLGIMTTSITLKTDGQESKSQVGPYMLVSKTTVDGNTMTTEWHSEISGDPVQGKWVRTLSDDGKRTTLVITESSTHDQKGNATLVLRRK